MEAIARSVKDDDGDIQLRKILFGKQDFGQRSRSS